MRENLPVTQRELELENGATLMSTTDTRSHLTYANAAFVAASGFERDELMGRPHNLVRRPDMPQEAFADMWATLKNGHSWTALVKNRRKNGDHYWVRANACPLVRDDRVVGYISVRTRPHRDEVAAAELPRARFRQGRAKGLDAAINQLDQSTQQNAALVEQSATAATSLQSQASRLAEAVEVFRG